MLSSEAGLFNLASKPTTWMSSINVAAPNFGISGGRARGWEGGAYPLAEECDVDRRLRSKGDKGDQATIIFGARVVEIKGTGAATAEFDWRNCWGRDFVVSS